MSLAREARLIPTFVIGLREGVEAAIIVGIVAAFLNRTADRRQLRWMWFGVIVAAGLCLAGGIALHAFDRGLPQKQQEGFETIVGLVAVATVTWMIVWAKRHARGLKSDLEERAASAVAEGTAFALIGMAFFAILREGFETAVFLLAAFQSSTAPVAAGAGVLLGLATAVFLGYLIYRGGTRINYARFFRITGMVLVFVAAGILAFAVHTAHEAGWVNILQERAVDLRWLVAPGTVRASLLTGMLGLQPEPTVAEVAVWLLYVIPMSFFVLMPGSSKTSKTEARATTTPTREAVG
jgi:high-affinity iron transporter